MPSDRDRTTQYSPVPNPTQEEINQGSQCPLGNWGAHYSCKFCYVPLHRGDDECECSTLRRKWTHYASLCSACATVLDLLHEAPGGEQTRLAKIHAALLHAALCTPMVHGD